MTATLQSATARTYALDPTHSIAEFAVKHLMIATVTGHVRLKEGRIEVDAKDPSRSKVVAVLDPASVATGVDQRDQHLRSPEFLDAATFPTLTFVSTAVEGDGAEGEVHGDLTIRGVTRPVTLHVEKDGEAKDPWGNTRVAYTATTTIDRRDFGLTWNQTLETGGFLVGDRIKVTLRVQGVEQKA